MLTSEALITDLVLKVKSFSRKEDADTDDPVQALRHPAFEEFLTKIDLGLALYSSQGHFYYVSQSLGRLLGHPVAMIYTQGPALLQHLMTAHDRPLVEQIIKRCEDELKKTAAPVSSPRISFDYHIRCGQGELKRIYQHVLPHAVQHNQNDYTLFILHNYTGFKNSPVLNYSLSHLINEEKYVTLYAGFVKPPCPYPLTKTESDLLQQLAIGKNMTTIANEKHISMQTLKKHRNNILTKTAAKNMVALLHEGMNQGWIELNIHRNHNAGEMKRIHPL